MKHAKLCIYFHSGKKIQHFANSERTVNVNFALLLCVDSNRCAGKFCLHFTCPENELIINNNNKSPMKSSELILFTMWLVTHGIIDGISNTEIANEFHSNLNF